MARDRFARYRWVGALGAAALVGALLLVAAPASAARDRTAPTTPGNLRITATTSTSVSLAWNRSTDNSSNFWYCVQSNGGGCLRVDPPKTTLTRTRLLPSQTHTFSVYAVDAAGNRSANSNTVSFTTPPDTTPPNPAPTISVTKLFPTRVVLAWPQAVDNVSPQVWTTLLVNGTPEFVDRLGPPTATLWTLTPSTTYEFQVTVRDASGNVVTGPPLVVTTPAATDVQAPTAPTNLRATSASAAPEIWLAWSPSTDDTDPQTEIRYEISLDGALEESGVIGHADAVVYCVSEGPTEIVVRAVDTSGNPSGPSNTVNFECSL
jgi:chitodextrinase